MNLLQRTIKQIAERTGVIPAKTVITNWDNNNWQSGLSYQNRDLTASPYGFANAYTSVIAVNRSITLRADAIDALPWVIKRVNYGNPDDYEVIATNKNTQTHGLSSALQEYRYKENRPFFKTLASFRDLYGETYCELGRNVYGRVGLRLLNPLAVQPVIVMGEIQSYHYSGNTGDTPLTLMPDQVAYDYTFNPYDDMRGLSMMASVLQAANIDRNLKRFLRDFFVNNARPSVLISPKTEFGTFTPSQRQALVAQLQDFFKGSGNQYGAFVAQEQLDMVTVEQPDIQKQYAIQQQIANEIYSGFGIPAAIAGGSPATYKEGREVYDNFVASTILPIALDIADFVQAQLMPLYADPKAYVFEFDTSRLEMISEREITLSERARVDYAAGLISINEARQVTGLPPVTSEDYYLVENVPVPKSELGNVWKAKYPILTDTPITEVSVPTSPIQPIEPATIVTPMPSIDQRSINWSINLLDELVAMPYNDYAPYKALKELDQWYRFVSNRKGSGTRPFATKYTEGDIADFVRTELSNGADLADTIKRAKERLMPDDYLNEFIRAFMWLISPDTTKSLNEVSAEFEARFGVVLEEMNVGNLDSRRRAGSIIRQLVNMYGARAYRQGMRDGGVDADTTPEDQAVIDELVKAQSIYVSNLTDLYINGNGQSDNALQMKISMWANGALSGLYNAGLQSAVGNAMMEFKLGETEDHCPDCTTLNKQRHRYKEWEKRNLIPRTPNQATKCGGWLCKCDLVPVSGKARGSWI